MEIYAERLNSGQIEPIRIDLYYEHPGFMVFDIPEFCLRFRVAPMELDSRWWKVKHHEVAKQYGGFNQ